MAIIENQEEIINNCLDNENNYLLTKKNFTTKDISKNDIEKLLNKLCMSLNEYFILCHQELKSLIF